jgi:formylmethanofuran dehydrogenase subunit A
MVSRDERPESVDRALGGRVFGFADIALLTRLEPARQLGFNELGHLKIGAAANIAVYDLQPNMHLNKMVDALSNCWCLIKDGITVRLNGDFSDTLPPSIIRYRKIDFDPEILKHTALLQNPTLRLENLSITEKMAKQ